MAAGRINKGGGGLGCSGMPRREREAEREGECCCPEKKNGVLTPLIMDPRAGKDAGGRGGPDEAVGKS